MSIDPELGLSHEEESTKPVLRKRKKVIFLPVIILLIFGILFVAFIRLPIFDVANFEISGTRYMSDEEIVVFSGIPLGQNIFTANLRLFRQNLESIPRFSAVKILRKLPHTIVVLIEERETIAYVPYAGYFAEMDEKGNAIKITQAVTDFDIPIITGVDATFVIVGDAIEPTEKMFLGANVSKALYNAGIRNLSEVNVAADREVYAITSDGIKLFLGRNEEMNVKSQILVSLLASEREKGSKIKTIDVRVVTKPVITK